MLAVVFDGETHRVTEAPSPAPQLDEVLVRVLKTGICNTDLEILAGYMGFRGIPGHEFVGVVEQGPSEWLGKRVVGEINISDGTCDMCKKGIPSQCRHRTTLGIDRHNGTFAEYFALVTRNLHHVPDCISDDSAVFVEPLAAALDVVEVTPISPGQNVVLIGSGKLGLLVAQVLRMTGCDLSVIVRNPAPARLLERWGIRTITLAQAERQQASVVVDCTGNSEGFAAALDLVRPRGTIVLKSTYTQMPTADLTRVVVDEVRVIGSRCGSFAPALRLLESGHIDTASLIEGRYSLREGMNAIEAAGRPGALKIVMEASQ
ncbi:MAG: alcohol dehydrogenase catalytic domain-containing protein [Chloroflexi bacterium]|nr:alcohol dehydrogenase catalytic domain-containing protein [Chloroflexota bacterium]